jgi:hypothetical protein
LCVSILRLYTFTVYCTFWLLWFFFLLEMHFSIASSTASRNFLLMFFATLLPGIKAQVIFKNIFILFYSLSTVLYILRKCFIQVRVQCYSFSIVDNYTTEAVSLEQKHVVFVKPSCRTWLADEKSEARS